jgi:hypothetical protein
MDERQTLRLLAWILGGLVLGIFALNAAGMS